MSERSFLYSSFNYNDVGAPPGRPRHRYMMFSYINIHKTNVGLII